MKPKRGKWSMRWVVTRNRPAPVLDCPKVAEKSDVVWLSNTMKMNMHRMRSTSYRYFFFATSLTSFLIEIMGESYRKRIKKAGRRFEGNRVPCQTGLNFSILFRRFSFFARAPGTTRRGKYEYFLRKKPAATRNRWLRRANSYERVNPSLVHFL